MTITQKLGQTEMAAAAPAIVHAVKEQASMPAALDGIHLADYELKERLGSGGYGEVWRAIGPGGLAKAVKVLYGERTGDHAEAEIKSLERMRDLRHPFLLNIERIEVVNSRLIVVTELADKNLADRFAECRANGLPGIPREELLGYLKDSADALDFMVEQHGLQHLDVKPDNILLQGNHAKVGDFGLAKDLNTVNVSAVSGFTPMYAPPELFEGRPGRTSDQYSLAIVYQAMLTGKMPFNGRTAAQLTAQHLRSQPDLTELQPIDRPVIARALSKNAHSRYNSCGQFVEELVRRKHTRTRTTQSVNADMSVDSDLTRTALVKTQPPEGTSAEQRKTSKPVATSTVPVEGNLIRRSVFIGVGGLAGEILRSLKEVVCEHQQIGETTAFPILQIDSNRQSLSQLRETGNQAGLSADETMAIPLRSSKEYRSANSLDLSWLSRRWLFNIPRSGQVDGIRPLGRLALCDHRKQVESKLVQLIERAMQSEVKEATATLCGLPVDDAGVDVYIVGATSGGTGSGAIADIGLMIRQIVRAKAFNDVEIHGVLVHGTGAMRNVTDMQEANTACLLKELRHLATPGLGTDRGFSKTDDQRDDSPFDNTLFVHIGDGLNGHGFATGIREVGKFLFDSSATAAQFDFRQWRNEHGDEFSPDDQLRLIGIGLQDAETFRLASAQSKDLSALLLRSWCDFMAPQSDAEASKLPVELSDSQTLLTELRLTNETLPQQVMSLLRGTTGREIEAFATGLNDQLLTFVDPNTVSRGEVMDFLSREISKSTKPEGNQYSLHQIVFGVQATLTGNTRNCEQAIQSHLYQLIDLPHRLESAVAAAGFTRTTLKQTTRSCTELLREIEHTFSSLALEADPDERLGNGENAESAIRTFCQQYCVLLAYQTIYQCFLNHVSAVTDFVNSSIQELTSLRDQLAAAAAELSPTAVVSDDVLPQTIDEFDSHLRISTPQLLADFLRSARDVKNLSSNLVDAATRFLMSADPDSEGTAAIADPVNFPANAWPVLTVTGGRRRVLGLVPEGIGSSAWETKLKAEFGDCAAVRNIEDNEITVICEISGVSIDNVFGCLTHENPHLVDVASRIHTRNDIEW